MCLRTLLFGPTVAQESHAAADYPKEMPAKGRDRCASLLAKGWVLHTLVSLLLWPHSLQGSQEGIHGHSCIPWHCGEVYMHVSFAPSTSRPSKSGSGHLVFRVLGISETLKYSVQGLIVFVIFKDQLGSYWD